MTPYRVNSTWIDLDAVQTVEEKVSGAYGRGGSVVGRVTLAFRDQPLEIYVGHLTWNPGVLDGLGGQSMPDSCQAIWDQFIAAWKAQSTKTL